MYGVTHLDERRVTQKKILSIYLLRKDLHAQHVYSRLSLYQNYNSLNLICTHRKLWLL